MVIPLDVPLAIVFLRLDQQFAKRELTAKNAGL